MDYTMLAVQLAALGFALSFHEAAHAWAAWKLGDPTARDQGRLTLNPVSHVDPVMTILFPLVLFSIGSPVIFGAARPVPVDTSNLSHPKRDHMWIAAAGPISNLVLAAATLPLLWISWGALMDLYVAGGDWARLVLAFLQFHLLINLVLAVFNLIPVHPLDGSWVLSRFLSGGAERAYAAMRPYGFVILIVLLWAGLLDVVFVPVLDLARSVLPG